MNGPAEFRQGVSLTLEAPVKFWGLRPLSISQYLIEMIIKGKAAKIFLEKMNAAVMTPERLAWLRATAEESKRVSTKEDLMADATKTTHTA